MQREPDKPGEKKTVPIPERLFVGISTTNAMFKTNHFIFFNEQIFKSKVQRCCTNLGIPT